MLAPNTDKSADRSPSHFRLLWLGAMVIKHTLPSSNLCELARPLQTSEKPTLRALTPLFNTTAHANGTGVVCFGRRTTCACSYHSCFLSSLHSTLASKCPSIILSRARCFKPCRGQCTPGCCICPCISLCKGFRTRSKS